MLWGTQLLTAAALLSAVAAASHDAGGRAVEDAAAAAASQPAPRKLDPDVQYVFGKPPAPGAYIRVYEHKPVTIGPIDRVGLIRRVVYKTGSEAIAACYRKALQRDPQLAGRMDVFFVINAKGRVIRSEVKAPGLEKRLDRCLARSFKRLRFPPPRGGGKLQVNYPLEFIP